jgi:DNA-binding NarL/FixJ family response regulator
VRTGDNQPKIKLLVVDDHEVVRRGLAMVLNLEEDMEICCEAGSGQAAVEQAIRLKPDLILMDLNMPGMNGLEAARLIKQKQPDCKILMLTGIDADSAVFEALQTGIDGYVLKEVTPDELVRAIRSVMSGQAYLHPVVTRKVLTKMQSGAVVQPLKPVSSGPAAPPQTQSNPFGENLSEREREVLRGVALGQSNREIAESLIVSEETIRTHLKSAFRKLGVNDRTQAVVTALKHGMLEL